MGFRDVTLAFDDDTIADLDVRDVTLAYDDDAKGTKGSRNVTPAYDDYASGTFLGMKHWLMMMIPRRLWVPGM